MGNRGPAWLRKWLGDEYFRDVAYVTLFRLKPGSDRFGMLQTCRVWRRCFVEDCSLTEGELARIAGLISFEN